MSFMEVACDVGINFFDCAEGYSNVESERIMRQAIKKFGWKQNDIVVSIKVQSERLPARGFPLNLSDQDI